MVGGVVTSFLLELLIYPVIFTLWKWHGHLKPRRSLAEVAGGTREQ
jgi:Cu(I)/Ag(I) efflux system membrane protein CusA/SilA